MTPAECTRKSTHGHLKGYEHRRVVMADVAAERTIFSSLRGLLEEIGLVVCSAATPAITTKIA